MSMIVSKVKSNLKLWMIRYFRYTLWPFLKYVKNLLFPRVKNKIECDAFLEWIATLKCNLTCGYCIDGVDRYPGHASEIDIPALIRTLNETNKIFLISFSGGEPFLVPNIIEALQELTKKHYITLFTNLTSKKIEEFANKINPERVASITASLHLKELERLSLLDTYINNFLLCKAKKFNIMAIEIAYPPLLPEVEKYKKFFRERGIEIKFSPLKPGTYGGKKYPESYTEQELEVFGLYGKKSVLKAFSLKGQICNAGYNVAIVYPNGDINPCFEIRESIGNIYKKIEFKHNLVRCPFEQCGCPLRSNPYFFEKALEQCNVII